MSSPAHVIADAVNPLLTACLLAAPLATPRPADPPARFWPRAAAGVGLAVVVAEGGKALTHSGFPSGHETFALACVTLLVARDRRWLWVCLPLPPLLAYALVAAGYHAPVDTLGALLVGPPAALLCDRLFRPRPTPG